MLLLRKKIKNSEKRIGRGKNKNVFPRQDYGQYKQKVDKLTYCSPMSLSPAFWCSRNIYWRSVICCTGVEERGEQRQHDKSFVCASNTPLSLWGKDNWQSHLVLPSSILRQQPRKNRLPVCVCFFFLFSLTPGWLIQCPQGTYVLCILPFVLLM